MFFKYRLSTVLVKFSLFKGTPLTSTILPAACLLALLSAFYLRLPDILPLNDYIQLTIAQILSSIFFAIFILLIVILLACFLFSFY